MKRLVKRNVHTLSLLLLAAAPSVRAELHIWNFDRSTINVASGVKEFSDDVVEPGNATALEKDGAGALEFDLSAANQRDEMRLNVTKGNLVLKDERAKPTASAEVPSFIADKAALWLKPDVNRTASAGGGVADWFDCREASAASVSYWHAAAAQLPDRDSIVYPETHTVDGKTYLNFGGVGSYCTLKFSKPGSATTADMPGIYHIFAITRIVDSVGQIFGTQSARPAFRATSTTLKNVSSIDTVVYFDSNLSAPVGLQGQYRLNGRDMDLTATSIKTNQPLLIEWEAGVTRTSATGKGLPNVGAIYLERTNNSRAGGDDVGEYLIFTNRLTAAERTAVEDYLMANWIETRKEAAGYTLNMAEGSEAHLNVSASELADGRPFAFSGGTLVKKGSSALRVRPRVDHTFDGHVRVDEGSLIAETRSLGYDFRSGEGVSAVTDRFDVVTMSALSGVPSGTARAIGGGGSYVVSRIGSDIEQLEVDGRRLVLAAPSVSSVLPTAENIEATFIDPSFEKSGYSNVESPNVATYNGWTFAPVARSGGNSSFYVAKPTVGNWTMGFDYVPPRGEKVLTMRGTGAFWTTVGIPAAGRYELTFKTCPRVNYTGGEIVVSLCRGDETNQVAKLHPQSTNGFRMQRVILPDIEEAGDYVLRFEQTHDQEHFCSYSDFKVSRVTDRDALSMFQVPNGDFEDTTFSSWAFSPTYDLSHVGGVAGWTLTQTAAATSKPAASPVAISMNGLFKASSSPAGNVQLMLVSEGAAAGTTQAFTLPAGRWHLAYLACRWGLTDKDTTFMWNDKYVGLAPVIEAKVTVGGVEKSLGSSKAISNVEFTRQYSDIIEIPDGGALVKVRLVQTTPDGTYYAGALIDDVCFVRAAEQKELVENGSFEEGNTAWRDGSLKDASDPYLEKSTVYPMTPGSGSSMDTNYGTAVGDGRNCRILVQTGALLQDIDFKEAGTHRISFWVRGRSPASLTDVYAGNQVRAALIQGGETNEITRTESIYSTNFCQHVRLFNVPRAGVWTLMLQGVNGLPLPDGTHELTSRRGADGKDQNVLVDAVSVRKAEVLDAPEIPKTATLVLNGQTKLDLDYPGSVAVTDVYINGRRATKTVNAANYPGYVTGIGSIEPKNLGLYIIVR